MERKPRRQRVFDLCPAAGSGNRIGALDRPGLKNVDALPQTAEAGRILAGEKRASEIDPGQRLHQPIDGEQPRRRGEIGNVRLAHVESGRDFEALARTHLAPVFEAAFDRGTRPSSGAFIQHAGALVDAGLRTKPAAFAQSETLFEAHLRLPQPQIAGIGQGRHQHLRQRHRIALSDQWLVLPESHALIFPIDLHGCRPDAQ